ncbi:hypothetical protein CTI12_AA191180 [Artemisia annua]|uniref:Uncharacterized protein n=1 Tax=Artemisia annua TaxID=35608 RepID=A0A2U1P5L7_ARTAN|nr:hypothetical protein CTI12_AA191180 [Artemisia annua]
MAGISLIIELLRKNPKGNGLALHSTGLYSTTVAATSAAVYVAANTPFASKALYGFGGRRFAYYDVGHTPPLLTASETVSTKEYDIELKPLLSAFHLRPFALTSLRCFLMFYLPLLQSNIEEHANVSLHDLVDEYQDVDYVLPLKITVKQILLEDKHIHFVVRLKTSVVTTRRVLERLAVHHLSQRAAWKLIKAQFLGYAASWLVQVGIECYRFVRDISKSNEMDDVNVDAKHKERVKILRDRVYYVTVRCCSSLISASIGSGISATLLCPSSGHSVGKNHTTRDVWFMRLVDLYLLGIMSPSMVTSRPQSHRYITAMMTTSDTDPELHHHELPRSRWGCSIYKLRSFKVGVRDPI